MPNLTYRTIDVDRDRDVITSYFKDTIWASSGSIFSYDEPDYLARVRRLVQEYPDGFVIVEEDGKPIGQLELRVKEHDGRPVGYVSLYYLHADYRSGGYAAELVRYAEDFFRRRNLTEYHLRVSPGNARALRFYEKHGMHKLCDETSSLGNPAVRMAKTL